MEEKQLNPRFLNIFGSLQKHERELFIDLLCAGNHEDNIRLFTSLVGELDEFLSGQKEMETDDQARYNQAIIQLFDCVVTKLNVLASDEWKNVLLMKKEKRKLLKKNSSQLDEALGLKKQHISEAQWLRQKGFMARQINGAVRKMLEALDNDADEISQIILNHQSSFVTQQPLSQSRSDLLDD